MAWPVNNNIFSFFFFRLGAVNYFFPYKEVELPMNIVSTLKSNVINFLYYLFHNNLSVIPFSDKLKLFLLASLEKFNSS